MKNPNVINFIISNNLRDIRISKKIRQEDIAKRIGLSRTQIVNIESGKSALSLVFLYKLCELYECNITDVMPSLEWFKENQNKKLEYRLVEVVE